MKLMAARCLWIRHIQYPVGQGGLHLCQLGLMPQTDVPLFSVVYDCGSTRGKRALKSNVANVVQRLPRGSQNNAKLDVLILSHLHLDHVNGFELLCCNHKVEVDRLIIPHFEYDDVLFLMAQCAAAGVRAADITKLHGVVSDPVRWFGDRGVRQVVAIRGAGPGDGVAPLPLPRDEPPPGYETVPPAAGTEETAERDLGLALFTRREPPAAAIGSRPESPTAANRLIRASNGTFLQLTSDRKKVGLDWVIAPFCEREIPGKLGHRKLKAFRSEVRKLRDQHRHNGNPTFDNHFVAALKSVWTDYVGSRHYTWNILSLACYLGRMQKIEENGLYIDSKNLEIWDNNIAKKLTSNRHISEAIRTSGWLMTGDMYLRKTNMVSFFSQFLAVQPVVQVPHHGAKRSFCYDLLCYRPHILFTTCAAKDDKHPSPELLRRLGDAGFILRRVTEETGTLLETFTIVPISPQLRGQAASLVSWRAR